MTLKEYEKKRHLEKTPEPKAKIENKIKKMTKDKLYVIQFHKSKKPHFDLRLEMDGVLKSWAVPKEPPTIKGVKRLAIQVEDHPLAYAKFEGIIPEGNYGAGTVKIWDNGTYDLEKQTPKEIEVVFHGKKLKGKYVLIKSHFGSKPEKSWLFFKV